MQDTTENASAGSCSKPNCYMNVEIARIALQVFIYSEKSFSECFDEVKAKVLEE